MSVAEASRAAAPVRRRAYPRNLPWEKVGLSVLLTATAVMFIWGLDRNGWANPYYSAAAQAGSQDWKAFFYGSLDAANLITVDKPPLSIWIMSLSVRLFGLTSWALLVPQALMGVATTWLIYKIVRRSHSAAPALLGGLIYATTPVVVLMSRYNNPEPLMGLLTVAAVYFVLRAVENNQWRWYLLAGTSLGLGFMAKQIQAFLPIPALVLAVLIFGAGTVTSRILRLLASLAALVVSGGWWVALVDLTPAANRPYVGGSATNSILELTLDYNGLARFIRVPSSDNNGTTTSNDSPTSFSGGISRIFDGNFAPEIAWLLFPGVALSVVVVVLFRSLHFETAQQQLVVLAVAWFTTALLLLCSMGSMIHTYYTFSLAAPLALVLAVGLSKLWGIRDRLVMALVGALIVGAGSYMAIRILNYSDMWPLWFRTLVAVAGICGVLCWLCAKSGVWPMVASSVVVFGLVLGPLGANIYTLSRPQTGTNPQSGPIANDPMAMSRLLLHAKSGRPAWALQIAYGSPPEAAVVELLRETRQRQTWGAATFSAQNAALYQLESRTPVIALGGWLGTDPAPTLEQFKDLVARGQIGYFIWQEDLLERNKLSPETVDISRWVDSNFIPQMTDGVKIFDLRDRVR